MKKVCLFCERSSSDSNLYCQEIYCPAELAPYLLEPGEWLGDLEIIRSVVVLRSAVLYEAQQNARRVLLKVAHPGHMHTERLQREATIIRDLVPQKGQTLHLPTLLPPYANTTVAIDPYGKAILRGQLLYFCLFDHVAGDSLRDTLLKNPQLWVYHVGWLMTSLAATLATLQLKQLLHYGLCPESVLVVPIQAKKKQTVLQPLLIDLGIASTPERLSDDWYPEFVLPGYMAPELIDNQQPSPTYRTDVYGLGILLYELLVGSPMYPNRFGGDAEFYAAVRERQHVPMNRTEDVRKAADLAVEAVSLQLSARPADAATVTERLIASFGEAPTKQRPLWATPQFALIIVGALLLVAFVVTLGVFWRA